jgi:Rha family phage regulatory protein
MNNDMPQANGQFNGHDDRETSLPVVFEDHGKVFANSRDVATYFKKDHKHVLRDIRKLISRRPDLNRSKFGLVEHPDEKGEMRPTYDMDRDGFTLLAMGFTGDEALEFKLRYIEAFNQMEVALKGGGNSGHPSGGNNERSFGQRSANEWVAACRILEKYEQMFPGNPDVIRWAAEEICGMEMPPKHILDRNRQGSFFGVEG